MIILKRDQVWFNTNHNIVLSVGMSNRTVTQESNHTCRNSRSQKSTATAFHTKTLIAHQNHDRVCSHLLHTLGMLSNDINSNLPTIVLCETRDNGNIHSKRAAYGGHMVVKVWLDIMLDEKDILNTSKQICKQICPLFCLYSYCT
uniref:Uncharacterized protein n=1 Tax=Arundo donax TaxID=35708 RepID=A0A0A9BJ82_ARUDO